MPCPATTHNAVVTIKNMISMKICVFMGSGMVKCIFCINDSSNTTKLGRVCSMTTYHRNPQITGASSIRTLTQHPPKTASTILGFSITSCYKVACCSPKMEKLDMCLNSHLEQMHNSGVPECYRFFITQLSMLHY